MAQVTVDEDLLLDAFAALQGDLHEPLEDSSCLSCAVMHRIELALGRELTIDPEFNSSSVLTLP